jgi:hypothetical protein
MSAACPLPHYRQANQTPVTHAQLAALPPIPAVHGGRAPRPRSQSDGGGGPPNYRGKETRGIGTLRIVFAQALEVDHAAEGLS